MLKIREAIVVEGKYDKNTLSQVVDATIIQTDGFGIFRNPETVGLLRTLAEKKGLIILTDSDGAGFVIRNYLNGAIEPSLIKHAYIPDIQGTEKRKSSPSKEGKLGVEGMSPQLLVNALLSAGATVCGEDAPHTEKGAERITKRQLYGLGLSGKKNSAMLRSRLKARLELPERLGVNALVDVLNSIMTPGELDGLLFEILLLDADASDSGNEHQRGGDLR